MIKQVLEDTTFFGNVAFIKLPLPNEAILDSVTPDVSNLLSLIGGGVVVTITNFLGGVDSQTIRIRGDGTTTIKNNTNIITNTGADKLLVLDKVYRFTYYTFDMKWVEDI